MAAVLCAHAAPSSSGFHREKGDAPTNTEGPKPFAQRMLEAKRRAKAEREAGLRPERPPRRKRTAAALRGGRSRAHSLPPVGHSPLDSKLWDRTRAADFARAWAQRDEREGRSAGAGEGNTSKAPSL
jgi:hypothetical protein